MDESWRISIGSVVPRRRSTDEPRRRRRPEPPAAPALDPEDFQDVFGGPPRSVMLRQFSGDLTSAFAGSEHRPASLYDEVFRPAAADRARGLPPSGGGEGRKLPGLRIPAPERRGVPNTLLRTEEGFYNDIFGRSDPGGDGDRRSRTRSKSTSLSKSSSAISFEDVSPRVRASEMAEDAALSAFASKLRPITIPSRRHTSAPSSTISGGGEEEENNDRTLSINPCNLQQYSSSVMNSKDSKSGSSNRNSSHLFQPRPLAGAFSCCFFPAETMSLDASFRRNHKEPLSCYNFDAESPSSVISSVFHDPSSSKVEAQEQKAAMEMESEDMVDEEEQQEEGEEAIATSYVIELNDNRDRAGGEGAAAIDEAIAWAKEKFWSHQMDKDLDNHDDQEVFYSIEATE